MVNVLPPNNSVVHRSQVQWLDVTNFIHDSLSPSSGAPNENIVQIHLNIALLNVF